MQRDNRDKMNADRLSDVAALAMEETLSGDGLPDDEGILALLDLLEEAGEFEMPDDETLQRQKQQTLRRLRAKKRFSPRRVLAAAAAFAVLLTAAVLGVLQQSGKLDLLPSISVSDPEGGTMQVQELLESLHAHAFRNVALSQVFFQEGWTATAPTFYTENGKQCADFQVYRADACYCFSLKTGEVPADDYAALGAERVLTVEKQVVVYVFGNSDPDMSEMRYRLNDLTYSVTANVPAQTMIHAANQIETA